MFSITQISSPAQHSAFCDLLDVPDGLLACYRQATNHVSADGRIETCWIDNAGKAKYRQHLWFKDVDLRDPKLSYLPDGRILLIAYARHTHKNNQTRFAQSVCWTSQDGRTWSSPRYFGPKHWWLWRLSWCNNIAYGFAYNRKAQRVDLYAGHPLKTLDCIKQGALSKVQHGYGYPNESDIWFPSEGKMHVILRRDEDSFSALFGQSEYPYTRWSWHDLNTYIGGPKVVPINASDSWVGGRGLVNGRLVTCIWRFCSNTKKLELIETLPSRGDNSYPGLVYTNKVLNTLYYSTHIDQQTRVYLARLRVK